MNHDSSQLCVLIKGGSLYLSHRLYETYFRGLRSAVLLRREQSILLLPVNDEASGGLLIKVMNSRGDRVIHALEFFQAIQLHNLDQELPVEWDSTMAGLRILLPAASI